MRRGMRRGDGGLEVLVVVAVIGMLSAIAIPSFIKARDRARDRTERESNPERFHDGERLPDNLVFNVNANVIFDVSEDQVWKMIDADNKTIGYISVEVFNDLQSTEDQIIYVANQRKQFIQDHQDFIREQVGME